MSKKHNRRRAQKREFEEPPLFAVRDMCIQRHDISFGCGCAVPSLILVVGGDVENDPEDFLEIPLVIDSLSVDNLIEALQRWKDMISPHIHVVPGEENTYEELLERDV